jgi:hypothetical protein
MTAVIMPLAFVWPPRWRLNQLRPAHPGCESAARPCLPSRAAAGRPAIRTRDINRSVDSRKDWPQAWREHAGLGESTVYLTQAELAGIGEAIDAVLMRYIDERPIDDVASRPEGSVPVTFTLFAVPGGPPPGPGTATEA